MIDKRAVPHAPLRRPDSEHDGAGQDLHICNNYRHLLMALSTIATAERPAVVVYLEDTLPIAQDLRGRLKAACPHAEMIYTRDALQIDTFTNLPRWFPAILRRNLAVDRGLRFLRPHTWQPALLAGRRFDTIYIYHAGFFLSKVIAGRGARVVLRESGLNNYFPLPVPPIKAVMRWLSGLPPRWQIWGEEPWIDAIEVSHPQALPAAVRPKASKLTFSDTMDAAPGSTAQAIAAAFLANVPSIAEHGRQAVILLTQPLDSIGICTLAEKQRLYEQIAAFLIKSGYQPHIKPHPLEGDVAISGTVTLPYAFPIEAWPYFSDQKFALAVALCSASLLVGAREFSQHTVQLLTPEQFNARHFPEWPHLIANALERISTTPMMENAISPLN